MSRMLGALAAAVLTLTTVSASAADAKPVGPVTAEFIKSFTRASCFGWSASTHTLACVTPKGHTLNFLSLKTRGQSQLPLGSGGNLAEINATLKKGAFTEVAPVYTSGAPRATFYNKLTVGVDGHELTIVDGTAVRHRTNLKPPAGHGPAIVQVFAAGEGFLVAAITHQRDPTPHTLLETIRYDVVSQNVPASKNVSCPAPAKCPPTYGRIVDLLGRICAGEPTDDDIEAIEAMLEDELITPDDGRYLAAAVSAMAGKKLKPAHDAFYYQGDGAWLPKSCVANRKTKAVSSKLKGFRKDIKRIMRGHR